MIKNDAEQIWMTLKMTSVIKEPFSEETDPLIHQKSSLSFISSHRGFFFLENPMFPCHNLNKNFHLCIRPNFQRVS
jgi:hypothetical protein